VSVKAFSIVFAGISCSPWRRLHHVAGRASQRT
jgi:hypothetical protein